MMPRKRSHRKTSLDVGACLGVCVFRARGRTKRGTRRQTFIGLVWVGVCMFACLGREGGRKRGTRRQASIEPQHTTTNRRSEKSPDGAKRVPSIRAHTKRWGV